MAAIDRYTIEHEPIKSIDLMERAAHGWIEKFLELGFGYRSYAVVAGSGNNGGDGFAIARMLRERGYEVSVFYIAGTKMSPDCEENYKRWKGESVEITEDKEWHIEKGRLVIDALFGSGLNRKVTGLPAEVIRHMNRSGEKIVAVDIPSGLMGEDNSDNDKEAIVRADYTLTFGSPKLAFMLPENYPFVGEWQVVDIGLHPAIVETTATPYYYLTALWVAEKLPKAYKFAHKGMNGHGLLIAGSQGMMGAAVLASRAAVHSGIGLLTCHVPARESVVLQTAVPEALTETDPSDTCFSTPGKLGRYNAIAVGPGIGQSPETLRGLRQLLSEWKGALVLDADALNLLASNRSLLDSLPEGCVLTPHPGEFERLAGKSANDFERLNKLSIFASRYKVCVVLKGAHTVIASPTGNFWFNTTGNSGMAKGGMGDVLTGSILALLANGLKPEEAAACAVYAHGLAGDIAAGQVGQRGISAGIVAGAFGEAWHVLENR